MFQCLLIGGENAGPDAIRNAETFVVTDEQFENFIERHKSVSQLVPESNTTMRNSYLILDEYVREGPACNMRGQLFVQVNGTYSVLASIVNSVAAVRGL